MAKVEITWTTTTTERFKLSVNESKLPSNWREQIVDPATAATSFLEAFEEEHGESLGTDETVLSREVEYSVLDDTDVAALVGTFEVLHTATFIPSPTHPALFTVLCSCGESSFGAMLLDSAESKHAQHVADPAGGHFRDQAATARLLSNHSSRKATS